MKAQLLLCALCLVSSAPLAEARQKVRYFMYDCAAATKQFGVDDARPAFLTKESREAIIDGSIPSIVFELDGVTADDRLSIFYSRKETVDGGRDHKRSLLFVGTKAKVDADAKADSSKQTREGVTYVNHALKWVVPEAGNTRDRFQCNPARVKGIDREFADVGDVAMMLRPFGLPYVRTAMGVDSLKAAPKATTSKTLK